MTLHALTFMITSVEDGRLLGLALICTEAQYASVRWVGTDRLDRLHVTPADWTAIEQEVGLVRNPGPIPTDGAIYMLLAGERAGYAIVHWLSGDSVPVNRPEMAAETLDATLTNCEAPPSIP